jgi:peptidoglycan/xylan/chitin deacetylase (PgdA/CDA1 family)
MSLLTSTVSALGHAIPGTRRGRLMILIYHRVHPRPDPFFPTEADADSFDLQMSMVRRHCAPVTLQEGAARLRDGTLPPRAVAVTFDDGYRDNSEIALPILQRHGIRATFFVSTGFLDGGRMWNDSIIEAIRATAADSVDGELLGLGALPLASLQQRREAVAAVIRAVKHRHPAERLSLVETFCSRLTPRLPDDLMMSREQVRGLSEAGMEVGGHTVNHPILKSLEAGEAREEIERGRRELEEITNTELRSFAYPNGKPGADYTERDRDIVRSLRFEQAVATTPAVATADSDRWQLPRFSPWDRKPEKWLARLLLYFQRA